MKRKIKNLNPSINKKVVLGIKKWINTGITAKTFIYSTKFFRSIFKKWTRKEIELLCREKQVEMKQTRKKSFFI